jgi:hypothetical protein
LKSASFTDRKPADVDAADIDAFVVGDPAGDRRKPRPCELVAINKGGRHTRAWQIYFHPLPRKLASLSRIPIFQQRRLNFSWELRKNGGEANSDPSQRALSRIGSGLRMSSRQLAAEVTPSAALGM